MWANFGAARGMRWMKKKLIERNIKNTRSMMLKQRKKLVEMRKSSERKKIKKIERTVIGQGKPSSMYG